MIRNVVFALALLLSGVPLPGWSQPARTGAAANLVDINSAPAAELKGIPGIGGACAAAIIRGRPYKRKDELVDRKILPKGVYEKVKDRIVARQK